MKHKHFALNHYVLSILSLVVILVTVSVVAITMRNHTDAAPSAKPGVGAAVPSQFSFDGTVGWWQGATNETSMALFHRNTDDGCFVSAQYKTGIVDAAAAIQKTNSALTSSGYSVTPGTTQTLTLQTKVGLQSYELYQSTVTTPTGAQQVEGGQEFGYVQLAGGYIYIEGYCNTAAELPATIPALQAIKFNGASS